MAKNINRGSGFLAAVAAVCILAAPAAQAGHHHGAGILGALLLTDVVLHAIEPAPTVVVQQPTVVSTPVVVQQPVVAAPVVQQTVVAPAVQQQYVTTGPVVQYVTPAPVVVAPPPVVYAPPVRPAPIVFGFGPRHGPPPPHRHGPPPPPPHGHGPRGHR